MKLIELFEDTNPQASPVDSTNGNSGDSDTPEFSLPQHVQDQYEFWMYNENLAKAFDEKFGRRDDNPLYTRGVDKYTVAWIEDNPNANTAYYKDVLPLNPKKLAKIEGLSGEHLYIGDPDHADRISDLAQRMRDEGFDKKHAILIHVTPKGPKVVEGNHRIRAAMEAGLNVMPVEWRWLGGTEMNRKHHPVQYVHFKNEDA